MRLLWTIFLGVFLLSCSADKKGKSNNSKGGGQTPPPKCGVNQYLNKDNLCANISTFYNKEYCADRGSIFIEATKKADGSYSSNHSCRALATEYSDGTSCLTDGAKDVCSKGEFKVREIGCLDCPAGSYSDTDDSDSCKLCNLGQFQDKGQTSCKACGEGQFADSLGSTQCKVYSDITNLTCTAGVIVFRQVRRHKIKGVNLAKMVNSLVPITLIAARQLTLTLLLQRLLPVG